MDSILLQQMRDREFREVGREDARVELGRIQQGIEQLVHGGDGCIDPLDEPASFARAGVGAQLGDEQAKGVQRLAQIMAGSREKARLGEIGEFELARALLDLALETRIGFLELAPPCC